MHLLVITAFDFTAGGPVVARHQALATGWALRGGETTIALLRVPPASAPTQRTGVSYHGLGDASVARGGLGWRLQGLNRVKRLLKELMDSGRRPDAVLIVDRDPILLGALLAMTRKRGLIALHEITEYPDVVSGGGLTGKVALQLFGRVMLRRLNGVIVISPQIQNWVRLRARTPTLLIAGIVDLSRFGPQLASTPEAGSFLLGYCGSLDERKDGVRGLIRSVAMARSHPSSPDVRLRLIAGTHSTQQMSSVRELVDDLGLIGQVEVQGPVPEAQIPALLAGCSALALPRPVSRQAEGGFPTKLGEYLATGRPVIVTAVGSIPRTLRPGIDAILVPPNAPGALSDQIVALANDANGCERLGVAARAKAEAGWDPGSQADALMTFVRKRDRRDG